MKIEFLGTGGAIAIPRPLCQCSVCTQARSLGLPYSRSGPATFVHGPDVLIDTPEDIYRELNRSRVTHIGACFYSHWHPDHVMGRRVFESLNIDSRHWPERHKVTDIYLPQQVAADFRHYLGSWDHLTFMQKLGIVRIIELKDGDTVEIGETVIRPFRLAEDYVYAFEFTTPRHRVLIAPDELLGWDPPAELAGLDLAVLPMGIVEFDVFSHERRVHQDHPILKTEATFNDTLTMARKLHARRTVFTHIEEGDCLSHDDLGLLANNLQDGGLNATFAYDTLIIEL